MDLPMRRFTSEVPLPSYGTPGSVGLDCYVREEVTIEPKSVGYARLNFALTPPKGHFVMLAARSSLHKRGLMFANGVGIFDEDYCGDNDEFLVILYNFSNDPVTITAGDRVAQIIVVPYAKVSPKEVDTLGNPDRGGLGSTGR